MNRPSLLICALFTCGLAAIAVAVVAQEFGPSAPTSSSVDSVSSPAPSSPVQHEVFVRRPEGPPRVATDLVDQVGAAVSIGCAVCHVGRTAGDAASDLAGPTRRDATGLVLFHQGLVFDHGELACGSCHNPQDRYATLRLADGEALAFPEVITLCAQCHGPTHVEWLNGAHGGMTGHWDLARGPRQRNNCIDCHDPHAPQFPSMVPTFKPRDRFLGGHASSADVHRAD